MKASLRLPRFEFFYDTRVLLLALIKLFTADLEKKNKNESFLQSMCFLFQRKHALLVSSYRMSLFFSLKALKLNPGDEVLLTPITVADTINAIKLLGLKPVLVDLDINSHSVCLDDLRKKITPHSKVLLVTYLSGIVPDINQIKDISAKNSIILIEDISQNMDARYKGQPIGSHGEISIASLSCGKNISSLYGGLILTDDENLKKTIDLESKKKITKSQRGSLRYYLLNCIKVQVATSKIIFPFLVFPVIKLLSFFTGRFPLDFDHDPKNKGNIYRNADPELRTSFPDAFYALPGDWQINLMDHQLKRLKNGTAKRRKLAKTLLDNLSEKSLKKLPSGLLNIEENSFYHFPIYCDLQKNKFRAHLFCYGIDNGSYGLNLCSEEKVFNLNFSVPNAHIVKHETVFLPLHENYSAEQMKGIAMAVNSFFTI